jgi:photosystem II stability/assembly factor-like uncharacterized protein
MSRRSALPVLIVLLAALGAAPLAAGPNRWTPVGPFAGAVRGLTVARDAAGTVYAETADGLFRSANGGGSWSRLPLPRGHAFSAAVHPRVPQRVFAASPTRGLWRSDDSGRTWAQVSPLSLRRLVITPSPPHRLYGENGRELFVSHNGGVSWDAVLGAPADIHALAVDPTDSAVLYVSSTFDLYRSPNGGASWRRLDTGFPGQIHTVLVDPVRPATLYAVTDFPGGIYKSRDRGATWTAATAGLGQQLQQVVAALDPSAPATLYAGVSRAQGHGEVGELFRSRDGGGSWRRLRFTEPLQALAVDPLRRQRVYAGLAGNGVLASGDGGGTWNLSSRGLRAAFLDAVALDPHAPGTLLAAVHSGIRIVGLFAGAERGLTWRRFSEELRRATFRVLDIVFDPFTLAKAYLASHGGVFASDDGGLTWTTLNHGLAGFVIDALAAHPERPGLLFTAGYRLEPCSDGYCPEAASFLSRDGGRSWTRGAAPTTARPQLAFFAPGAAETVHLLAAETLYTSADGGAIWTQRPPPLEAGGLADLLADAGTPGVLYGVTSRFAGAVVLRSADAGVTWTPTSAPVEAFQLATALAQDPEDPAALFVATLNQGVYASADGGATWALLGETPPPGVIVRDLLVDPARPRDVYAVTNGGGGLFVLTRP